MSTKTKPPQYFSKLELKYIKKIAANISKKYNEIERLKVVYAEIVGYAESEKISDWLHFESIEESDVFNALIEDGVDARKNWREY